MNLRLQKNQRIIRYLWLLGLAEKLRYMVNVFQWYQKDSDFVKRNPDFKVPPKTLAYDAYLVLDWDFYKQSDEEAVEFLADISKGYIPSAMSFRVLEWGCGGGSGRVIRHIPAAFTIETEIYASNCNPGTINQCGENINHIRVFLNRLQSPLQFEEEYFDFIYSISVFTHLSEVVSHQWIDELFRIARLGGGLVITTNGDSWKNIMRPDELEIYHAGEIIIRDRFEEGKKMYWVCHSPKYLKKKLFSKFEVMKHIDGAFPYMGQDYWILREPL